MSWVSSLAHCLKGQLAVTATATLFDTFREDSEKIVEF